MTRAYAAMRDRLLVCERDDDGSGPDGTEEGGWRVTERLEDYDLECVAASPDAPDRVFVGTFENGLFRSTDGGETFVRLETGFVRHDGSEPELGGTESSDGVDAYDGDEAVMSLAISPHDSDVLYAGTEPSRVYRSADGGDTWTELEGVDDLPSEPQWFFPPRPSTHHARWLEVDPFDPDRIYVGIEAGAFVFSTDGGETWHERPEGSRRDNHTLAVHADAEGRVYTASGDGYAESDEGGQSWSQPQEGLEHRYCWGLAVDPGDPDSVLVSSASGATTAHTAHRADAHVYRKRNGTPWERLNGRGLPTGDGVVRTVFATTGEPGVVYGVNNRGLFASRDFGDSWERVGLEWPDELETQAPRGLVVR
ncbi:hypothetical protein [Halostagnicola sp. A-GB9-2]|uniref:WD40/YVTN/BNR-like repeat-containing protein n=1 Tax=Halostagnicola sp. A-GB9-2 TaxID=3048066 RepID=UPI0024BF2CB3|nr:hypothetical protein [Halostagnicola sp. A-GB9-2]MDJ1432253.1 hypothetical protein [Halostagnicola sp. A-GB9-2]